MPIYTHNPAELSPLIGGLFPAAVTAASLPGGADPDLLLPQEAPFVAQAVLERKRQFTAGRLCARRALAEFGIVDFALEAQADRQPVWPSGMVGSITHTRGFCAAIVARRSEIIGLGIDTEEAGRVKPELWPRICGPELPWLRTLPEHQQPLAATLIFSAKEAFYKCQYAVAGEWLEFKDVRIGIDVWNEEGGRFLVHACRPLAVCQQVSLPWAGRYLRHAEFFTAGISATSTGQLPERPIESAPKGSNPQ